MVEGTMYPRRCQHKNSFGESVVNRKLCLRLHPCFISCCRSVANTKLCLQVAFMFQLLWTVANSARSCILWQLLGPALTQSGLFDHCLYARRRVFGIQFHLIGVDSMSLDLNFCMLCLRSLTFGAVHSPEQICGS